MNFLTVFSAFLCLSIANGANILGLFTSVSPSHNIVHLSVVKPLIEQGHNVTIISRLPMNDASLKFNQILVPLTSKEKQELEEQIKSSANLTIFKMMSNLLTSENKLMTLQYDALGSHQVQDFLKSGVKIDAVIIGYFFNDFHLAVAAQVKAPIIVSWSAGPFWVVNSFVGNPTEAAYVPNLMVTTDGRMNFLTRMKNFLVSGIFDLIEYFSKYQFRKYYE